MARLASFTYQGMRRLVRALIIDDQMGTSFPPVEEVGFRFYRTDLGEWFEYQPTWGGWLGDYFDIHASDNTTLSSAGYLRAYRTGYTDALGFHVPWKAKVYELSVSCGAASTAQVQVYKSDGSTGSLVTSAIVDLSDDHVKTVKPNTGNSIAADQLVMLRLGSGSLASGYFVRARIRHFLTQGE